MVYNESGTRNIILLKRSRKILLRYIPFKYLLRLIRQFEIWDLIVMWEPVELILASNDEWV